LEALGSLGGRPHIKKEKKEGKRAVHLILKEGEKQLKIFHYKTVFCRHLTTDNRGYPICMRNEDFPGFCRQPCPYKEGDAGK